MIRIAAAVATFAVLSNVPQFRDALHLGDEPWMVDLKATVARLETRLRAALATAGARLAAERERLAGPDDSPDNEPSRR